MSAILAAAMLSMSSAHAAIVRSYGPGTEATRCHRLAPTRVACRYVAVDRQAWRTHPDSEVFDRGEALAELRHGQVEVRTR